MFRLHIENDSGLGDIFDITAERLQAALHRFPHLAEQLAISVGRDGVDFSAHITDAQALFAWKFDRSRLTEIAPELQFIQLQGAGLSHLLPLDWVPPGVVLTNSRGAHGERASEYLMMSILALNNGLPAMVANQRHNHWQQIHSSVIRGKKLLIYGVGNIGGDTARVAQFFGMHVMGIRRTGQDHESINEMYQPDALHRLLPQADFVINTAPHTPDTDQVFGEAEFALMKAGAGFVNYSRAGLVDYTAMTRALTENRIRAIVDVFEQEPLPADSELWQIPNLIITPHCCSNDPVNHAANSLNLLFENIQRCLNDEPLLNIVDPEFQY